MPLINSSSRKLTISIFTRRFLHAFNKTHRDSSFSRYYAFPRPMPELKMIVAREILIIANFLNLRNSLSLEKFEIHSNSC